MHHLIEQLLKKRGIERVEELSADEKATFDRWQASLTEQEITLEVLQKFMEEQKEKLLKELDEELQKKDYSDRRYVYLRARILNYEAILGLISAPKAERESLEEYLKQLISE